MAYSRGSRGQPRGGFQLYSWYFFRVSGVALLFLALGHIFFTHYLTIPSETSFEYVAGRYQGPLWRAFDWLLLSLALAHGFNGVQLSIDDYLHNRRLRLAATTLLIGLGYGLVILGSLTILIFTPDVPTSTDPSREPMWIATVMDVVLHVIAIVTYVGVIAAAVYLIRGFRDRSVYWGGWGFPAWALHRVTGLGIVFFLIPHIVDVMLVNVSPVVYDATVRSYGNPFLIPMEIALVGAVVYHAMNGIRVILFDISHGAIRKQQAVFVGVFLLTVVLVAPSAYLLIAGG